jgi:hypothetical protein
MSYCAMQRRHSGVPDPLGLGPGGRNRLACTPLALVAAMRWQDDRGGPPLCSYGMELANKAPEDLGLGVVHIPTPLLTPG